MLAFYEHVEKRAAEEGSEGDGEEAGEGENDGADARPGTKVTEAVGEGGDEDRKDEREECGGQTKQQFFRPDQDGEREQR